MKTVGAVAWKNRVKVTTILYEEGPMHFNMLKRRLGHRKANTLVRVLKTLTEQELVTREPLGKFVIYHPNKPNIELWMLVNYQSAHPTSPSDTLQETTRTFTAQNTRPVLSTLSCLYLPIRVSHL